MREGNHFGSEEDGCRYHPACLSCPFPVCIHDVNGGFAEVSRLQKKMAERRGYSLMRHERDTEPEKIVYEVAIEMGVTIMDIKGPVRTKVLATARKEIARRMRERFPQLPLKAIGFHLGGKDHSSVLYMLNGRRKNGVKA